MIFIVATKREWFLVIYFQYLCLCFQHRVYTYIQNHTEVLKVLALLESSFSYLKSFS